MAGTSEYTNAISSACMHVRSSSKLALEVTFKLHSNRPACDGQPKQAKTNKRSRNPQKHTKISRSKRTHQTASVRMLWEHATGSGGHLPA
eukprot:216598-Pleurochrysis_carterae.AAC.1